MGEITPDKFIDVLQDVHEKLDVGFSKVYKEIGTLREDAKTRQIGCYSRFASIETQISSKAAANGIIKEYEKDKRDTWKYVIRGLMLAAALAAAGGLYKLFILTAELENIGVLR